VDKHSSAYYDLLAGKLYSAVIADILDDLGARNNVMRYDIRPLFPEAVVVGRAATMLAVDVYQIPAAPYKLEMEALDSLKPGDVVVATTNGTTRSALWGELLSTATRARGGRGVILDGFTRDTRQIREMQFPVFATGVLATDSKGRCDVIAYNVPIAVGGVLVEPGDLIFADYDGGVVVPKAIEDQAVERALEKVVGENKVREALQAGMKVAEAFKQFGIL
jgi:4-hydroxy-4-methyl-2-oxoglutarate aldolase